MNQADRGQPDALQMPAAGCEAARRRIPLQFGFQPYNSPDPPKKFRCSSAQWNSRWTQMESTAYKVVFGLRRP